MPKVINTSLDEIIELSKRLKGKRAYIIKEGKGSTDRGDMSISAVFDVNQVLYNSEEEFGFYDYETADKVYFDNDKHPYWKGYFGKEHFKLYDGIFIGNHGCGGGDKYISTIKKAKSDLSSIKDYKSILHQFEKFHKKYLSEKDNLAINKLRAKFGIIEANKKEDKARFDHYLRFEDDEDKDILFFWEWFTNNFINEAEYEKKIEKITNAEHEKAFKNYTNSIVASLEHAGFKKVEK